MRDLANKVSPIQALPAKVHATADDDNGTTVDLQGYNSVCFEVNVGVTPETWSGAVRLDFTLQDAADDGAGSPDTWANVIDNNLVTGGTVDASGIFASLQDDAADDNQVYKIGYVGGKRFARVNVAVVGTQATGTPLSATAVRGMPHLVPTA